MVIMKLTCRNRSILALECSGPAPSIPSGSKTTRPVCKPHFASPEVIIVSKIICAPLKKSPNCAGIN